MLKQKVKIFSSHYDLDDLENKINNFLQKENISIIKINNIVNTTYANIIRFSVMITYSGVVELNNF